MSDRHRRSGRRASARITLTARQGRRHSRFGRYDLKSDGPEMHGDVVVKRVIVILSSAVATLAIASSIYQKLGDRRDRRRFQPPGQLIELSGTAHHLWVTGTGSPPIVFIPALGGAGIEWVAIQRRLQDTSTAALYDRAGLGWSESRCFRRTTTAMVEELHELLHASDLEGPYLLVGGSIGGLVARMYAGTYPAEVAGVILSDSSHEEMDERIAAVDPRPWYRSRWGTGWRRRLQWLGLRRLAYDLGRRPTIREVEERNIPSDLVDAAVAQELGSANRRAVAAELQALSGGFPDVIAGRRHLGDLPLTVITGGPGSGPMDRKKWYHVWLELQADLVAQSNRTRHVLASHAFHHVHHDDPELVAEAIREMVDQVRHEAIRGGRPGE